MKYLSLFLSSIIIFSACDKAEDKASDEFIIDGKVKFLRDEYVKIIVRKDGKLVTLDSTKVADDSTFTLRGKVDNPQYAQLNFYDKQVGIFPLTADRFTAYADGNQSGADFSVTGTEEADLHKDLTDKIGDIQLQMLDLRQKLTYAMGSGNEAEAEEVRQKLIARLDYQNNWVKSFVDSLGTDNIVGGYALVNYLNPVDQYDFFDKKVKEIEAKSNPTEFEIEFMAQFNNKRADIEKAVADRKIKEEMDQKLGIGKEMPDIELPNPEGKTLKLSDYEGKVVLVDFWAGWCRPCRQENPNLVSAYKKYKGKGFEIFGVSLDRTRDQWLKAIEDDNMTWPQVSDLAYWESAVVKEFNITGIPANFLLDRNGVIIARNLRGPALHSKLDEVFN